jgi:ribosome-associated protein
LTRKFVVRLGVQQHTIEDWEFQLSFARSSGAGGQNVNKVESKANIDFYIMGSSLPQGVKERFAKQFSSRITEAGCLRLSSDAHRDRERNISEVINRLTEMIESVAIAPKIRRKTKRTRGSNERRLSTKKGHSDKKQGRGKINRDD